MWRWLSNPCRRGATAPAPAPDARRPAAFRARGAILIIALLPALSNAQDWPVDPNPLPPVPVDRPASLTFDVAKLCGLIRDAAAQHDVPLDFFTRLIWQESRFDISALSPVGAQGIAQFMPETARIRGLQNPWDPRQALPASAAFLAELKAQFGNFGLAAAAYNSGPNRVARWLTRSSGRLPYETENYVLTITARPAAWFREEGREVEKRPLEEGRSFDEACARLPVVPTRSVASAAPWGVQIAAGITYRAAQRNFRRARARLSAVVGGRGAIIVRSRKVGGRRLYSARVGAQSRGEARRLCSQIRRIGGNCLVRRN